MRPWRFAFATSHLPIALLLPLLVSNAPAATPPQSDSSEPGPGAAGAVASGPRSSCPKGMVLLPGGTYGVERVPLESNIQGRREVSVPPFCLDITEVTVDSYKTCVQGAACTEPNPQGATRYDQMCNWKNPGRGLHPSTA